MNELNQKPRGLFINPAKANCSIYESGKMMYESLLLSRKYDLDYMEVDERSREIPNQYDFYAFNYHYLTMGWLDTKSVRHLPGVKITFVLETLPNNPFILCPADDFDAYCAIDPTMNVPDKRVYAFPRPLEIPSIVSQYQESAIPVIGTFGFATKGKGFELVVNAVNKEFERAVIRINIPAGTYVDEQTYAEYLAELCKKVAKNGIDVIVTHEYMSKSELIEWCGQNTLNCFLYTRNMPGLSATTDQAISSGRPLAVSDNETFRHIHPYIKPYPFQSLKESISSSQLQVLQMQKDWAPNNFATKFEEVLEDFHLFSRLEKKYSGFQAIKLQKKRVLNQNILNFKKISEKIKLSDLVPPIFFKIKRRINHWIDANKDSILLEISTLKPFVHKVLGSYSQHNEDLIIDLILGNKPVGFYVDVGANDPSFNSNTQRFYSRGWSGINIEPGLEPFKKLCDNRPRDVNLNVGIAPEKGKMQFYQLSGDTTLSSLNEKAAKKMARLYNLAINTTEVAVLPLKDILEQYVTENKAIDFLSVDAEGFDLSVLRSNDWSKYRPSLIVVELNNEYNSIVDYLEKRSYLLIYNNSFNGIFIDRLFLINSSLEDVEGKNKYIPSH